MLGSVLQDDVGVQDPVLASEEELMGVYESNPNENKYDRNLVEESELLQYT